MNDILKVFNTSRNTPRLRPRVLGTIGFGILALAVGIQAYALWVRWTEDKIGDWAVEIPLDFSKQNTYSKTFVPIVSRSHSVRLSLRAPLSGELANYDGKEEFLPADVTEKSLVGKSFKISWQIVNEQSLLEEGIASAADLKAWAMIDHIYYQYAWKLDRLDPTIEYSLAVKVEHANEVVNEYNPILTVRTWGSLKGHATAGWRISDSALLSFIGVVFLVGAWFKHTSEKKAFISVSDRTGT